MRTLPGAGLKEAPLTAKPLGPVVPVTPAEPLTPSIERAPVAELPVVAAQTATQSASQAAIKAAQPPLAQVAAAPVQLALAAPAATGGPAAMALAKRADGELKSNDLMSAAATLERALRIEPNNAALWSRLAEVRLRQGDRAQAEQLALKSSGLAGADVALKARNEQIIAQARGH